MTHGWKEVTLEKKIYNKTCNWFYQIWDSYYIHKAIIRCCGQKEQSKNKNPYKLKNQNEDNMNKKEENTIDELRNWIKGLRNRQHWKANEWSGGKVHRKSLNIEIKSKNRKYERKAEIK